MFEMKKNEMVLKGKTNHKTINLLVPIGLTNQD